MKTRIIVAGTACCAQKLTAAILFFIVSSFQLYSSSLINLSAQPRSDVDLVMQPVEINPYQSVSNGTPSQFAGGSGTFDDPYLIESAYQLNQIRNYLSSSFRLIDNIDLNVYPWNEGQGWLPLGTISDPFTGAFDGDWFEISNLYINRPETWYVGVFGFLTGATVKEVFVRNTNVTGSVMVGSIGGKGNFGTLFENIHVNNASIIVTYRYGGGLIGGMDDCTVRRCSSNGFVKYLGSDWNFVGGLIGGVTSSTTNLGNLIEESFCKTKIYSSDHNSYGGLLGVTWIKTKIQNCYSRGTIVGSGDYVGGFLGEVGESYSLQVLNNYSTTRILSNASNVHGFLGFYRQADYEGNFWDFETSGLSNDPVATGLSTSQMKNAETFQNAGWDFNNVWAIDTLGVINQGYPFLKYEIGLYEQCFAPTSTSLLNLTDCSCHLQWIMPNSGVTSQLLWGPKGFNPATEGNLVDSISTQDFVLNSLTPNTAYDVYLRTQCNIDVFSQWSNKFSFKTLALFSVSGGGSYCANDTPNQIPVTLSGSQSEVNYCLLRDGLPFGDTLAGNDSPLQWNNLLHGIYKVKVFTDEASLLLVDSVIIVENPSPIVEFIIPDDTICLSWDTYALSGGQPEGGVYSGFNVNGGVYFPAVAGVGKHNVFYTYTNEYGCSKVVAEQLHVDDCLTLNEKQTYNLVRVMPNPVREDLHLLFRDHTFSEVKIQIFNSINQLVYTNDFSDIDSSVVINIADLPKGLYIVVVGFGMNDSHSLKFIKQ